MRTRALSVVGAGGLLAAALAAGHALQATRTPSTQVLGEHLTRPATGLHVALTADRTTLRAGEPVTFTASWSDDAGRRLGWSTLLGDEGAAKYQRVTACPTRGDADRFTTRTSYARPGHYTAYVEITTGGCGAATETRRAEVAVTVTP